jgi:hypothetical protein
MRECNRFAESLPFGWQNPFQPANSAAMKAKRALAETGMFC